MLLPNCATKNAVLLLGCPDERGILYFPDDGMGFPGLMFEPKALMPIVPQLIEHAQAFLKVVSLEMAIEVNQDYAGKLKNPEEEETTLYVAKLVPGKIIVRNDWMTLPEIMRLMPKDKNRIPYLLAWQVLQGALDERTKAVDLEELQKVLGSESPKLH